MRRARSIIVRRAGNSERLHACLPTLTVRERDCYLRLFVAKTWGSL